MFSTKQSDIFYNDQTKEMFVCKVSAISAERCEDNTIVYGALPLVYKINKADNYKKLIYPKNLDTFSTDPNSDIYNLTPTCAISGTNFNSITKPLINYNKTTSRYSVTFLGRYSNDTEGLGLNNYIFQDINTDFYLLDAIIYIPKDKDITAAPFTFENGYLNSNLYVVGNTIRNDKTSWFNPANEEIERSTDYQIAPMYVQATSSLGFNLALGKVDVTLDNITGDIAFPFMYSGGFITYNPKYVAYDPEYTIRVDFTARSFTVPSPTAYGSTQSVGQSATRWIQQWTNATTPTHGGPGEGFCVSFFKNPPVSSYVIPNGIGSTLGYAKAGFSPNEVVGTAHATHGLYVHNNWNPNTGLYKARRDSSGNFLSNINTKGYLGTAESFLGVGFDVGGNFATQSEEKEPWFNYNSTWTATPCSVGIRASTYYDTQVLTAIAMDTVAASAVPMHTSAANAQFVDYRIDLSNKGNTVTIYNKLTSATDYNTILEYRLNKAEGCIGKGVGTDYSTTYQPWWGMQSEEQKLTNTLPPLNVGLSFTTSDAASNFELLKFEVVGVKVNNPWVEKKEPGDATNSKRIDYLQASSKNLRKKLLNVESDDLVDVEMVVPAKNIIANTINEETNKPQITLCDGTEPEIIEENVDIKITGIQPEQVDKLEEVIQGGNIPKTGGITTITFDEQIPVDTTVQAAPEPDEPAVFSCDTAVQMSGGIAWPAESAKNIYGDVVPLKFNLGSAVGVVILDFHAYDMPDRFQVFWPGPPEYAKDGKPTNLVIDTGFWGAEKHKQAMINALKGRGDTVTPLWVDKDLKDMAWNTGAQGSDAPTAFDKTSTVKDAYVKVWAPAAGTLWNFTLGCPAEGTKMSDPNYANYNTGAGMDYPLMANGKPYEEEVIG